MKYWMHTELDNWEVIHRKLNQWVDTGGFVESGFFWNGSTIAEMNKHVPELRLSLAKKGQVALYFAFIIARPHASPTSYLQNIHVDDMTGVAARLQLPVRNTEGSFTHFFSASKNKIERRLLPNGHAFWWVDPAFAKHETKVCIDRPTYIRTGEPHSVQTNPNIAGVRITATIQLSKDPGRFML
jgi:hypothetical protein